MLHIGIVVVDGLCEVRVSTVPPVGFTRVETLSWSEVLSKLGETKEDHYVSIRAPRNNGEAKWIREHR